MKKLWNGFIAFVAFAVVIALILLVFSSCNDSNENSKQKNVATTNKFKELTKITTTPVAFDHQGCQYPQRWSNPADGCDNTDPAVPECLDEMDTQEREAACIKAYQERNTPTTTRVDNPPIPQCGAISTNNVSRET